MIDRKLTALDGSLKAEVKAVITIFLDWKEVFLRKCQKHYIQRDLTLFIPMLLNYYQKRSVRVKTKGVYSTVTQLI